MLTPESKMAPTPLEISAVSDAPREKCGIVGVYSPEGNAVQMAYLGLKALQHRGQDGAGFSFTETDPQGNVYIGTRKALGRIANGFNNGLDLDDLTNSENATGHTRYETSQTEHPLDALHPIKITAAGSTYTVAHNGQFIVDSLFQTAEEHGVEPTGTDTEVFAKILGVNIENYGHIEPALQRLLPQLEGAFNLSILSKDGSYAVADRHNMRPFVLGRQGDAVMFASEVRSLTAPDSQLGPQLDFELEREITGGTYLAVNRHGVREEKWAKSKPRRCLFEHTYLSKADNVFGGVIVEDFRVRAGEMLAEQDTVKADIVVPVLGSAKTYAHGYADASGVDYVEALTKNPGSGRIFIEKTSEGRRAAVKAKFKVDAEAVNGKKITVVDDSLVRGDTTKIIVEMLRDAGAEEVHVRIGTDVFSKVCKYGVNVQSEEELLAYNRTVEEMAQVIGADSLDFLPIKQVRKAGKFKKDEVCDGCTGGSYPEPLHASKMPALVMVA